MKKKGQGSSIMPGRLWSIKKKYLEEDHQNEELCVMCDEMLIKDRQEVGVVSSRAYKFVEEIL
jgi:hypothetical protein